jgi:putative ATPase
MEREGFGAGYVYDHDVDGGFSGQDCFPPELGRPAFYGPTDRGGEAAIGERVERLLATRQ